MNNCDARLAASGLYRTSARNKKSGGFYTLQHRS